MSGSGWSGAAVIENANEDASAPQIAVNGEGNAFAVWRQHDDTRNNIYANRYVAGSGWETAVAIENGDGDADAPQVAIDSNGNAIAVWHQDDGSHYSIYANIFAK